MTDQQLLESLIDPVRDACRVIESVRTKGLVVRTKTDASPVTEADEAAEAILSAALRSLTPAITVVGEEAFVDGAVAAVTADSFWLIDPVDGTREFISGGSDYTVNVALVRRCQVQLGIVATPRSGRIWLGGTGLGAWMIAPDGTRQSIRVRQRAAPPVVLMSASHLDAETKAFVAALGTVERLQQGSSVKFCAIAEGKADIYPRFGPTSEWDTAAGHAVLEGAGGRVETPDGAPFRYGKAKFSNGAFIAYGA